MSGALAAIRRTLNQAPKLSRSLQTGRTLRGGHHDVSLEFLMSLKSTSGFKGCGMPVTSKQYM